MTDLQTPSNKLLNEYLDKFYNDDRYYLADKAIESLFEAFPENKHLEHILLKISVINDLYSTNIFGTFKLAKHIQMLDIDLRLEYGDPLLVNDISSGHGIISNRNNKEINFYSFATKYCNWHNRNNYAIYDSFVNKVLIAFKRKDNFSNFTATDIKDFVKFKRVVLDFKEFYNLTAYDLKQIDKFLWIYGKEKFPTIYNQK